jgi:hypothetical protein
MFKVKVLLDGGLVKGGKEFVYDRFDKCSDAVKCKLQLESLNNRDDREYKVI